MLSANRVKIFMGLLAIFCSTIVYGESLSIENIEASKIENTINLAYTIKNISDKKWILVTNISTPYYKIYSDELIVDMILHSHPWLYYGEFSSTGLILEPGKECRLKFPVVVSSFETNPGLNKHLYDKLYKSGSYEEDLKLITRIVLRVGYVEFENKPEIYALETTTGHVVYSTGKAREISIKNSTYILGTSLEVVQATIVKIAELTPSNEEIPKK